MNCSIFFLFFKKVPSSIKGIREDALYLETKISCGISDFINSSNSLLLIEDSVAIIPMWFFLVIFIAF
jgi:hypothetical protein